MARRPIEPGEQARIAFEALVAQPASSRRSSPAARGSRALAQAREEVEAMVKRAKDGGFDGAEVKHAVALHAFLHRAVTGVEDAELEGEAFLGACSAAGKLCREAFGDQALELVEFVRWAWARERRREARRRARRMASTTTGPSAGSVRNRGWMRGARRASADAAWMEPTDRGRCWMMPMVMPGSSSSTRRAAFS